jgi:hypothetical protein
MRASVCTAVVACVSPRQRYNQNDMLQGLAIGVYAASADAQHRKTDV